jgi:hypothetical protein
MVQSLMPRASRQFAMGELVSESSGRRKTAKSSAASFYLMQSGNNATLGCGRAATTATSNARHGYERTREAAMAALAKRAGAEAKGSRSLARSSSPPWLRSVASECPICPMFVDLTPHCIR